MRSYTKVITHITDILRVFVRSYFTQISEMSVTLIKNVGK